MSAPAPTTPYTIGALEGAAVAVLGAFAAAYAVAGSTVTGAALAGAGAFAAFLGYHAYQNS